MPRHIGPASNLKSARPTSVRGTLAIEAELRRIIKAEDSISAALSIILLWTLGETHAELSTAGPPGLTPAATWAELSVPTHF